MGTIIALLYRTNDMIFYAAKLIKRSPLIAYRRWAVNALLFLITVLIIKQINLSVDNYIHMIITGVILSVCIIPSFALINSVLEIKVAKDGMMLLKKLVLSRCYK